jgi:hypothetical protein
MLISIPEPVLCVTNLVTTVTKELLLNKVNVLLVLLMLIVTMDNIVKMDFVYMKVPCVVIISLCS